MKKSTKVDMGTSRKFYKLLLDPGAVNAPLIDMKVEDVTFGTSDTLARLISCAGGTVPPATLAEVRGKLAALMGL